MKIYINKKTDEVLNTFSGYEFVSKIKMADEVIIVLNNLGSLLDIVEAIDFNKHVYLVHDNKDIYKIFIETKDSFEIYNYELENSINDVVLRMEERKNEKSNNGKTRKLL